LFDHFSILLLNIKISKFFEILWNFWVLKNQALCQYIYGSLYHVIQLPVMTSDWKRMNKSVVNNVHLRKKKTLTPPTPVPSPGANGGGLCLRHVNVYWVYLKLKIPWPCLFMHFIFLLRNYILIHKAGFTLKCSVEDVNSEMSKVSSENFEIILQFAVFTCIH
jgi:hypothetical protein